MTIYLRPIAAGDNVDDNRVRDFVSLQRAAAASREKLPLVARVRLVVKRTPRSSEIIDEPRVI